MSIVNGKQFGRNMVKLKILFLSLILVLGSTLYPDSDLTSFGKTTNNKAINLENFKGKVVIVTFWASWCPQCQQEIPVLNSIAGKVSNEDLVVIAINSRESKKEFKRYISKYKDSNIIFTHDENGVISDNFEIEGVPYLIMYDYLGEMKYIHTGFGDTSLEKIVKRTNKYLAELQEYRKTFISN